MFMDNVFRYPHSHHILPNYVADIISRNVP